LTIKKVFDVEVHVDSSGEVTLVFTPLHGGISEKDADGDTLRFGIPLNRDAQGLAGLVHDFARWITGLCVKEIQAQQAQIQLIAFQANTPHTESGKRNRKGE
jgi:hypothetical protein